MSAVPPLLFDSFESASKACLTGGYQYDKLVELVVRKNKILQDTAPHPIEFDHGAMRTLTAVGLSLNKSGNMRILDFGGGGGYHWFIAKNGFAKNLSFDWRVVETAAMAKKSTESLEKEGLKFYSDIKSSLKTGEVLDLVFTSSALQYCEDPLATLQNLVDLGARYLFITRTPFSHAPVSLISSQKSMLSENGPGLMPSGFEDQVVEYPITFVPKNEAERIILEKYDIRFSLKEESGNLFFGDMPVNSYYGFFCELKNVNLESQSTGL